jgi:ornithine decarboxylase
MDVYGGAVEAARGVLDAAVALGMPPMRVLDIGGGFKAGRAFDEAAAVIFATLERYFGELPCVEVIGEHREAREYWIDDGLYGTLMVGKRSEAK